MSHTVAVTDVDIVSVSALRAAVKELQEKGVPCALVENVVPRAYYTAQAGMDTAAEFVLRSDQSPYDVGFYKTDKGGKAVYEPRTDTFMGYVGKLYGNAKSPLGKLTQLYSVHAVTQQAVRQGYRVSRKEQQDGTITLSVMGG
jgi:ABC-type sugar transport system substrate-binding protein